VVLTDGVILGGVSSEVWGEVVFIELTIFVDFASYIINQLAVIHISHWEDRCMINSLPK